MKQHITLEQLQELSLEARKKYDNLLFNHPDYGFLERYDDGWENLLTIGQMIEFLIENDCSRWYEHFFEADCHCDNDGDGHIDVYGDVERTYHGELCDALWEKVKEELERFNAQQTSPQE